MRVAGHALAVLGMLLVPQATFGKPLPEHARYVAMGSSFAAGVGIGTVKPGTPLRCSRSEENYASLLAAKLNLTLDDETCGGARTTHLLTAWNEIAAQIDSVNPDTRLVTATIGGNDLNYVSSLLSTTCRADNTMVISGHTLRCPQFIKPTEADYATLEANMRQIVRTVRQRAPQATFVFVQYVTLVPQRPCDAAPIAGEKAAAAREIGERLAMITARAARLEGAKVIDADRLSRHHTACDARPWSIGAKEMPGRQGVLWHPTRLAHVEIAKALERYLAK